MIEDDNQYQIKQTKLRELQRILEDLQSKPDPTDELDKIDRQYDIHLLSWHIEKLKKEIKQYLGQTISRHLINFTTL